MAGASTAAPLDAIGAQYWNPATISGLPRSEVMVGGEFLYADSFLSSEAPIRGFGGRTRSNSGFAPLSATGFVYQPEDSKLTYGVLMGSIAGGGVNFEGTPTNPVLAPTSAGDLLVLGSNTASAAVFQTAASISWQVTDKLALGGGPLVHTVLVGFNPAFFAVPDDANGDGTRTFPAGTYSRPFWGGGFRLGAYYHLTKNVDIGFSYTSTGWLETWKYNSKDELGNPREVSIQATLPRIISLGVAYKGIEGLVLASDVRWMDYADTKLFGDPRLTGWQSIWAFAFGGQYQLSKQCSVQMGYLYNQNPLIATKTLFNTQLPVIVQHSISAGFSYRINDNISTSLAYIHGFKNEITGPIVEVAGSNVTLDAEFDAISFGLRVQFGKPRTPKVAPCEECPPESCPCEQPCEACPTHRPAQQPLVYPAPQGGQHPGVHGVHPTIGS